MSLSKQIGAAMIFVLSIAFIGLFISQMQATQTFVERQLTAHAQDTATSLGLAIAPSLQSQPDLATIDTMINAIFDRGYYQSITFTDNQQNVLIQKSNPRQMDSVPNWFQLLINVESPRIESAVTNGWNTQGNLTIQSHPGFAYEQLYSASMDNLIIFGTGLIIAIIISLLIVRSINRSLIQLQSHANQIIDGRYQPITAIPKTRELKHTVLQFNNMSHELSQQQQRDSKEIKRYKYFALTDNQTKLANRRAFTATLQRLLQHKELFPTGTLYIIRLKSAQHIGNKEGYESVERYANDVAVQVTDYFKESDFPQVYRLNDHDFAVFSTVTTHEQQHQQITALYQHIKHVDKSEYAQGIVAIGAGDVTYGSSPDMIMTRADNALTQALTMEPSLCVQQTTEPANSKTQWRAILENIIQDESIAFKSQTINQSQQVLYQEWFTHFTAHASHSTKDIFANAHAHGYMLQFDKIIVTHAIAKLTKSPAKIAINISRVALVDPHFQAWFFDALPISTAITRKLIIEIPERAIIDDVEQLGEFIAQAKIRNIEFTIERFGAQLASIQHLKALRPNYLKLDPRFTCAIHLEDEQQRLVKTLVDLAHSLGIKVIAEQVESEAQALCLESIGVDCLQGFEISPLSAVF